jgi:hypothetical protein
MSRAHDPDPGTPGDLDPSWVRKLLHRKEVEGVSVQMGLHCMDNQSSYDVQVHISHTWYRTSENASLKPTGEGRIQSTSMPWCARQIWEVQ